MKEGGDMDMALWRGSISFSPPLLSGYSGLCIRSLPPQHHQRLPSPPSATPASACLPLPQDSHEPLLLRAARGEQVPRPPAWMMRQAGRYMASYQKLAQKHPSFRERSETADLIVEISLQPWHAFRPDGVILFSDILTPLPAIGIDFDIHDSKGPLIHSPIRSRDELGALHRIDLDEMHFVGEALHLLRREVGSGAAILGFVGAPWTLASYIIEGGSTRNYKIVKTMCYQSPGFLSALLTHLAKEIAEYTIFQVKSGAQCVMIFDSWGGQLTPDQWDLWSKPYIQKIVNIVKQKFSDVPLILYINGNGGLLERMQQTGVDVIGLDWTVDMADARSRISEIVGVQGNLDPTLLFAPLPAISEEMKRIVKKAGRQRHILNLGHGVLVGTPEESVAYFFETARSFSYDSLYAQETAAISNSL